MRCTQAYKHLQYPLAKHSYFRNIDQLVLLLSVRIVGSIPLCFHIKAVAVTESVGNWARGQRVSGSSPGCGPKLELVLTEVPRHLQNASEFSDP